MTIDPSLRFRCGGNRRAYAIELATHFWLKDHSIVVGRKWKCWESLLLLRDNEVASGSTELTPSYAVTVSAKGQIDFWRLGKRLFVRTPDFEE